MLPVDCGHFDSREECDQFFCPSELRQNAGESELKVSLEDAFSVSITANSAYYLSNNLIGELEQDLDTPVDKEKLTMTGPIWRHSASTLARVSAVWRRRRAGLRGGW